MDFRNFGCFARVGGDILGRRKNLRESVPFTEARPQSLSSCSSKVTSIRYCLKKPSQKFKIQKNRATQNNPNKNLSVMNSAIKILIAIKTERHWTWNFFREFFLFYQHKRHDNMLLSRCKNWIKALNRKKS
jgi:hypothetical protein